MKKSIAQQLHNNDEVIIIETNEIVKVVNVSHDSQNVFVEVYSEINGYTTLTHSEIN